MIGQAFAHAGELAEAEDRLTDAERAVLAGLRFPKRRHDWLLGRLAAKRALAAAAGWDPAAVTVWSGPEKEPRFTGPDGALAGWTLTLTHGHGVAAAVAAPGPVGLDLERVRAVEEGGWKFFLAPEERARVAAGLDHAIVYWAVKEAAYKALSGRVESMPTLLTRIGDGRATVALPDATIDARWAIAGGFCLAAAAPAPAPAWLDDVALAVPPGCLPG